MPVIDEYFGPNYSSYSERKSVVNTNQFEIQKIDIPLPIKVLNGEYYHFEHTEILCYSSKASQAKTIDSFSKYLNKRGIAGVGDKM